MSIIDRLNAILGSEEHGAVNTENTPDINKAVSDVGTPVTEDKPISESVTNNVVKPTGIPSEAESATPPAKEVVAGTEEVSPTTVVEETIQDPALDTVVVQTPEGDVSVVETPEEVIVPPVVETPAEIPVVVENPAVEDASVTGTEEIVETTVPIVEDVATPITETVSDPLPVEAVPETVTDVPAAEVVAELPVVETVSEPVVEEVVAGTEEIVQEPHTAPSVDPQIQNTVEGPTEIQVEDSPIEAINEPASGVTNDTVASGEDLDVPEIVDPPIDPSIEVVAPVVEDVAVDAPVEVAVDVPVAADVVVEDSPVVEDVVMIHPDDHAAAIAEVTAQQSAAVAQAQMEAQESAFEAQYFEADNDLQTSTAIVESQAAVIEQTQSDIEKLEERIEDMEISLSGLEGMLSGMSPWNPELAKIYHDNCSRISSRTFGSEQITSIRGMESFSDKDTAKLEILAGTEAMKKRAEKMSEGVKQFVVKMFNTAIDFVESISKSIDAITAKADVLAEAVNKAPEERIKETINLGAWNAYVNIEKGDGVDHLSKVRKALSTIGDSFKSQEVSSVVEDINRGLKELVGSTTTNGKFSVGSADLGGITFKVKTLANAEKSSTYEGLSQLGVQFAKNSNVKTSGEHKSGYGKQKLLALAKATKSEAGKIKDSKITAASLKTARDKIVASFNKSGENKNLKTAASTAINISRTLFNYQVKLISAQQEMIYAHIKK